MRKFLALFTTLAASLSVLLAVTLMTAPAADFSLFASSVKSPGESRDESAGKSPDSATSYWESITSPTSASFRGLSVVSDTEVWVSGTGGTFLWTDDGGITWTADTVAGAASYDFRDVHAISMDTVFLMSAGQDTARIYRTADRGRTWTLQYNSTRKGMFLNAISFFSPAHGIALGDPIDGKFTILRTEDGGITWSLLPDEALPAADSNEVTFAASGTSLATYGASKAWFVTGGAKQSRVFYSSDTGKTWKPQPLPILADLQSRGAFSVVFWSDSEGAVTGGDYASPDSAAISAAATSDGGRTWKASVPSDATAYLSAVAYVPGDNSAGRKPYLIGVGTPGTSVSTDGGINWILKDYSPLNAVSASPNGTTIWAVGAKGTVVKRAVKTHHF